MLPTASIRKLLREHLPPGPALAADPEGSKAMFEAIGRRLEPLAGVDDVTQRRLWRDDARPIVVYEIQEPGDETYHWRSLTLEFSINEQHELVMRTTGQTVPIADLGGVVTFVRACQAALQRRRAQSNKRRKLCHLKTQAIIARIKAIAKEDGFDFIKPHAILDSLHIKIIAGMVGSHAALAFRAALSAALALSAADILLRFGRTRAKLADLPLQDLVVLNEQIMLYINAGHYPAGKVETVRKNLLAYLRHLKTAKQQEALAQFASLTESPKYERAMGVLAESLALIELLTDYIEGIQIR